MNKWVGCLVVAGTRSLWLFCAGVILWHSNALAQPTTYVVDPAGSTVHIYTDTSGFLGTFGHKHLIAITGISGEVVVAEQGGHAQLIVRPDNFLVDNDAERARAVDPEYREPVSERVRTGTRKNMLGKQVLDSTNYPEIAVNVQLDRLSASPLLQLSVTILGEEHRLQVPAILDVNQESIRASGYFELKHSNLGMEPFTAAGGMLKVSEKLRIQFEILANARSGEPSKRGE
mgnify:CR=1 FL=1